MSEAELRADIEALSSIVSPLPLAVVAAVVDRPADEVAAAADAAAADGALTVDRQGVSGGSVNIPQGRMSILAGKLAEELVRRQAPPQLQARAHWAAGDASRAYDGYRQALAAGLGGDERTEIVDLAIEAGREANRNPSELADLLVGRARVRRNRGEGQAAVEDLDAAIPHLDGEALVDALAFAAAIEDDLQHPADAERVVAMAMLVAAEGGLDAKLGSLSTFHGRVLSRVGFEREADDAFDRGLELVERHGTEVQKYYAALNRAWTDLDRGWMQRADSGFSTARAKAESIEDAVSVADKDIYLARAKFGSGDAGGAVEALLRAGATAESTGAVVLPFLIAIAESEGALAFGRAEDALAATARLNRIVEESFPAWVNRAATLEARAKLLSGDLMGAREAVERGKAATPLGPNGARVMAELDALGMASADTWDAGRAADLGDRLVQSGWLGTAAWFLVQRSKREKNKDLGRIAAALAHRLGNPMLAAEAVEAGEAWGEKEGAVVSLALQRVARTIPAEWEAEWKALPAVEHGLSVDTETVAPAEADVLAGLDEALTAAGLGGTDTVLSPSQRRAAGLVVAPSRVASVFRWVAPLVTSVAVVFAALFITGVFPPDGTTTTTTTTATTTTTTTTQPWQNPRPTPQNLSGQSPFAGGDGRNAVYEVDLAETYTGYYWQRSLTGFVRSDPILRGRALYVGTSEGFVSALDIAREDAAPIFEEDLPDAVESSFASDDLVFEQGGQSRPFVLYGDAGGTLWMRNITDSGGVAWSKDLGSPVTGPPLMRGSSVVVATTEGLLVKLQGDTGDEIGRFPAEGFVESGFAQPLAAEDGLIYAVTTDGRVKVVDEETMTEFCEVDLGSAQAVTHPVIAEGRWFIGTSTTAVFSFGAGSCSSGGGIPAYQIDVPIKFAPAVVDGVMWNVADELLLPIELETGVAPFVVSIEGQITGPPVVAGDYLLIGAVRGGDNQVVAIRLSDGSEAWSFPLDGTLRTRPVVGDGVVVVATDQGATAIALPTS